MKKRIWLVLFAVIMLSLIGCSTKETVDEKIVQTTLVSENIHNATLLIEGMTCTSCALGIEYQLKEVEGVLDAKISYEDGMGYVVYDADKVTSKEISQASDVYLVKVIKDKIIE